MRCMLCLRRIMQLKNREVVHIVGGHVSYNELPNVDLVVYIRIVKHFDNPVRYACFLGNTT